MSSDLPSDTAFEMFLVTVTVEDLSPYELAPYRHARSERLMEN